MSRPILLTAIVLSAAIGSYQGLQEAEASPCSINTWTFEGYCMCIQGASYESCSPGAPSCSTGGFCQC
jgi:hypothetical protein